MTSSCVASMISEPSFCHRPICSQACLLNQRSVLGNPEAPSRVPHNNVQQDVRASTSENMVFCGW